MSRGRVCLSVNRPTSKVYESRTSRPLVLSNVGLCDVADRQVPSICRGAVRRVANQGEDVSRFNTTCSDVSIFYSTNTPTNSDFLAVATPVFVVSDKRQNDGLGSVQMFGGPTSHTPVSVSVSSSCYIRERCGESLASPEREREGERVWRIPSTKSSARRLNAVGNRTFKFVRQTTSGPRSRDRTRGSR